LGTALSRMMSQMTAPQQNFGMPTVGSVVMVVPSALTVPAPARRQSLGASPLRGDSSKYQSWALAPGARPRSLGAAKGTGRRGMPRRQPSAFSQDLKGQVPIVVDEMTEASSSQGGG